MKKIFVFLFLFITLTFSASAQEFLIDNAGLLDNFESNSVREHLEEVREKYAIPVVIVTVNSLHGKTAESYADDYFDYNGYGENGILLLVAMDNREWHISTKGESIEIFSDKRIDAIEQRIVPSLSDGQYFTAFEDFIDMCRGCFEEPYSSKAPKGQLPASRIFVPLAFGIIIGLITVVVMTSQLKSVKSKSDAGDYVKKDSFNLTQSYDRFLWRHVSRTRRQNSSSSSSTHTSSSSSRHGGRGGRF